MFFTLFGYPAGGGGYLCELRNPYGMHTSELLFFTVCVLGG